MNTAGETDRVLALIPARGGSKRLPKKNSLILDGLPLIGWSILAAKKAECFDTICVSTDDLELRELSTRLGAEVPFLRPSELSTDTASSADVVAHALNFYKARGRTFDRFVLLQPTSPLRGVDDILGSLALARERNANSVVGVCEAEHSPLWQNTLPSDHSMEGFLSPDVKGRRSQDLPRYFRLNGAIYTCKVDWFLQTREFLDEAGGFAYIMDQERSVDIDTQLDFQIAEILMKKRRGLDVTQ